MWQLTDMREPSTCKSNVINLLKNQLAWDICSIVLLPLYVHVWMCVLTINRSLAPISTASKKAFSNLWCLEERSQKHCKAMTRKHKEESIRRRRWCVCMCTWAGDGRIGERIGWWGLCTPVWQCLRGVCRGHKTSPAQLPTDLQSYTTGSNMYKQCPQPFLIALDTKYQTKWNL